MTKAEKGNEEPFDPKSFKFIAKLMGICPFAHICQNPNWYWYTQKHRKFVLEVCFSMEHQKCTYFESLMANKDSPEFNEETARKFIVTHRLYRPNPFLSKMIREGLKKRCDQHEKRGKS